MHFDPFEILMKEHRVIEKNLDILESIIRMIEKGEKPPVEDLEKIIDFIKTFADKCHHGKEEKKLFPILEERGIPKEEGPIGVMLIEHEEGRKFVANMVEGIEKIKNGNENGYREFAENAKGYVTLLREHIFKEDNILFKLGQTAITDIDRSHLGKAYEEVEKEIGEGIHERFEKTIHELYNKYVKKQ